MAQKNNKEDDEKLVIILSYFLIGIIWYFIDEKLQKSKLVKFHVKQALNLFIIGFAINIILEFLNLVFGFLSFFSFLNFIFNSFFDILFFLSFLDFIFKFIFKIICLFLFVLWVIGLINGINLEKKEIPLIGSFANKYLKF